MITINDEEHFIEVCKNSKSMADAAGKLGLHFNTFKRIAEKLECYFINPGLKGFNKPKKEGYGKYILQDILDGKHIGYATYKLKLRLFEAGLKINKCEICGLEEWQSKPINCELNHIDGNRCNFLIDNLQILCPNCHSQTDTFRARNKSLRRVICEVDTAKSGKTLTCQPRARDENPECRDFTQCTLNG